MKEKLKDMSIKEIAIFLKENNNIKFFELLPQLCFGVFAESIYGNEISDKIKETILENIDNPPDISQMVTGAIMYKIGNFITKKHDKDRAEQNIK